RLLPRLDLAWPANLTNQRRILRRVAAVGAAVVGLDHRPERAFEQVELACRDVAGIGQLLGGVHAGCVVVGYQRLRPVYGLAAAAINDDSGERLQGREENSVIPRMKDAELVSCLAGTR